MQVSDLEKTILDCAAQPESCGELAELAKGLWMRRNDLNENQLVAYAKRREHIDWGFWCCVPLIEPAGEHHLDCRKRRAEHSWKHRAVHRLCGAVETAFKVELKVLDPLVPSGTAQTLTQ